MIDFGDFCSEIFQILRAYGREIVLYDESGNRVYEPVDARRFYVLGENILISIREDGDNSSLKLYLSQSINLGQATGFIEMLRELAVKANLLFHVKKFNKEIKPQDFATKASVNEQENLNMNLMEGLYGTSKSSYLKLENARMIVRHSAKVNERMIGSRGRNIQAIFVENALGERSLFPVNMLSGARAMTQHVNQGGSFADEVGQQIIRMAQDFRNLAKVANHGQTHSVPQPEAFAGLRESIMGEMKALKRSFARVYEAKSYVRESARIAESATLMEDGEALAGKVDSLIAILGESIDRESLMSAARLVSIPEAEAMVEDTDLTEFAEPYATSYSDAAPIAGDMEMDVDSEEIDDETMEEDFQLGPQPGDAIIVTANGPFKGMSGTIVEVPDNIHHDLFVVDVDGAHRQARMKSFKLVPKEAMDIEAETTVEQEAEEVSNNPVIKEFESWMEGFDPDTMFEDASHMFAIAQEIEQMDLDCPDIERDVFNSVMNCTLNMVDPENALSIKDCVMKLTPSKAEWLRNELKQYMTVDETLRVGSTGYQQAARISSSNIARDADEKRRARNAKEAADKAAKIAKARKEGKDIDESEEAPMQRKNSLRDAEAAAMGRQMKPVEEAAELEIEEGKTFKRGKDEDADDKKKQDQERKDAAKSKRQMGEDQELNEYSDDEADVGDLKAQLMAAQTKLRSLNPFDSQYRPTKEIIDNLETKLKGMSSYGKPVMEYSDEESDVGDLKAQLNAANIKLKSMSPFDPEYVEVCRMRDDAQEKLKGMSQYGKPVMAEDEVDEATLAQISAGGMIRGRHKEKYMGQAQAVLRGEEPLELDGKKFMAAGSIKATAISAGMTIAASYNQHNQGVDLAEVLGFATSDTTTPEFSSLREMAAKFEAKTLKDLESKTGVYMIVKMLDDNHVGPFYYLYDGRFCRGSGAEKLSFVKMNSASVAETQEVMEYSDEEADVGDLKAQLNASKEKLSKLNPFHPEYRQALDDKNSLETKLKGMSQYGKPVMAEEDGNSFQVTDHEIDSKMFNNDEVISANFVAHGSDLIQDLDVANDEAERAAIIDEIVANANDFLKMHDITEYKFVGVDTSNPENFVWSVESTTDGLNEYHDDENEVEIPTHQGDDLRDEVKSDTDDSELTRMRQLAGIRR